MWQINVLVGLSLIATNGVFAQCQIDVSALSFGDYDVFSPAPLDQQSRIQLQCDQERPVQVSLSAGQFGAGVRNRVMQAPLTGEQLRYNLFLDPGYAVYWGDGISGDSVYLGRVGTGFLNVPIYGRIFPQQMVASGAYSDTVIVTVAW